VGEGVFQLMLGPIDGSAPARPIGPSYEGQHGYGFDFSPDGSKILHAGEGWTRSIDVPTGDVSEVDCQATWFPSWQRVAR